MVFNNWSELDAIGLLALGLVCGLPNFIRHVLEELEWAGKLYRITI